GVLDAGWPAGGRKICSAAGGQELRLYEFSQMLLADGYSGAIVVWVDQRSGRQALYAHHVLASGQLDLAWPVDGRLLSAGAPTGKTVDAVWVTRDGSRGAPGARGPGDDPQFSRSDFTILVPRLHASGAVPLSWPVNGRLVCNAPSDQTQPCIVGEGGGRAIVVWYDYRNGGQDTYCQRIDPSSYLGNPNPNFISPLLDWPLDQGGFVDLKWEASYLENEDPFVVDHYWVERQIPQAGGGFGWDRLQRVDATHTSPTYEAQAPTLAISTAGSPAWTTFRIAAYDARETLELPSDPDSAYSIDNLPPETPDGLTGAYAGGATHVHWPPNQDADL